MCGGMFLVDIRIRGISKLRNAEFGMGNKNSEICNPKSAIQGGEGS
jgi:hypothetical protein